VEHAVGVAVGEAPQNLVEVGLHGTAQHKEHSPALQFAFHVSQLSSTQLSAGGSRWYGITRVPYGGSIQSKWRGRETSLTLTMRWFLKSAEESMCFFRSRSRYSKMR
jgi:hypothetical protein